MCMCFHYFVYAYTVGQPRRTLFESYTLCTMILNLSNSVSSSMLLSSKFFFSVSGCCLLRPLIHQATIKSKQNKNNNRLASNHLILSSPTTDLSSLVHHPAIPYLCYFIHPRTTMVIKPVEETLVNSSRIPPWFSICCQGLPMMPNNWVWERNWGSWGESNTMNISCIKIHKTIIITWENDPRFSDLTSWSKMKLFYYDFVLKEWVPTEMKANPVAEFVVFKGLNLWKTVQERCVHEINFSSLGVDLIMFVERSLDIDKQRWVLHLQIDQVAESIFIIFINLCWEVWVVEKLKYSWLSKQDLHIILKRRFKSIKLTVLWSICDKIEYIICVEF